MSLQDRIKRTLSPLTQRASEKGEDPTILARQDRAGTVTQLQNDVRRLQHEIADVSQNAESGSSETDKASSDNQIVALQKELEQTQHALAKLQGRI
jgi:predicted  nucleic acid-binding Zn-ribbon protein